MMSQSKLVEKKMGTVIYLIPFQGDQATRASQVALVVKNPPANAGDIGDAGSIPGSGSIPRGEHGNPLQYSCLENPTDRGVWWATVHRVAKSQTRLSDFTFTFLFTH